MCIVLCVFTQINDFDGILCTVLESAIKYVDHDVVLLIK